MLLAWLFLLVLLVQSGYSRDIQQAKAHLHSILNIIHQRYVFDDPYYMQLLYVSINIKEQSWDIVKLKFLLKILQEESFLMIFGGTSVTAGHDNYYYQSYPFVFERKLSLAFQHLGMSLLIHNIAQGGNDCLPSDLCYDIGGDQPDWISWEQSFNCGRDTQIFELIARYAGFHNAVMFYMASGGAGKECPPSTDTLPAMNETWIPSSETEYIPNQNTIHGFKESMNKHFEHGNAVGRFTSALGGRYPGTAAHGKTESTGQNCSFLSGLAIWGEKDALCSRARGEAPSGCVAADLFQLFPCYSEGGPHYMTYEFSQQFANGVKSSHHPPIGQHLLRGEFLAYLYGHILLDTIYTLEEDLSVGASEATLIEKYKNKLISKQPPMPDPKCPHEICAYRPYCYNNYQPHFEELYKLDSIILQPLEGWELRNFDLMGCGANLYGYADCRYGFYAVSSDAVMHLKVTQNHDDASFMVCGSALNRLNFYLDYSTRFGRNNLDFGRLLEPKNWIKDCVKFEGIPAGNYVFSISTVSSESEAQRKAIRITHFIHF